MREAGPASQWKVAALCDSPSLVHSAGDADRVYLGHPSVLSLPGGRLLVAVDQLGPGLGKQSGIKGKLLPSNHWVQGKLFVSSDGGESWTHKIDYPFRNGCLFRDGHTVYLLGNRGPLQIMRSADGGESWSKPSDLKPRGHSNDLYEDSPASILITESELYVALMRVTEVTGRHTRKSTLAPALLRASRGANLTASKSWLLSEAAPAFRDFIPHEELKHFGVPFFDVPQADKSEDIGRRRWAEREGWSFPHAVSIQDDRHYWHDANRRSIHIVSAGYTHLSNFATVTRAALSASGAIIELQPTPAGGQHQVFIPMPGGNLKFDLLYDEVTKLFWLLGNQVRDSMTRAETLPSERVGLPCEDGALLQLSFSHNLVDWSFAGILADGDGVAGMHPCMAIRDNDLVASWCAGDDGATRSPHAQRLLFGIVPNFRELVYGMNSEPAA